jgi:hypothetical protein
MKYVFAHIAGFMAMLVAEGHLWLVWGCVIAILACIDLIVREAREA